MGASWISIERDRLHGEEKNFPLSQHTHNDDNGNFHLRPPSLLPFPRSISIWQKTVRLPLRFVLLSMSSSSNICMECWKETYYIPLLHALLLFMQRVLRIEHVWWWECLVFHTDPVTRRCFSYSLLMKTRLRWGVLRISWKSRADKLLVEKEEKTSQTSSSSSIREVN